MASSGKISAFAGARPRRAFECAKQLRVVSSSRVVENLERVSRRHGNATRIVPRNVPVNVTCAGVLCHLILYIDTFADDQPDRDPRSIRDANVQLFAERNREKSTRIPTNSRLPLCMFDNFWILSTSNRSEKETREGQDDVIGVPRKYSHDRSASGCFLELRDACRSPLICQARVYPINFHRGLTRAYGTRWSTGRTYRSVTCHP